MFAIVPSIASGVIVDFAVSGPNDVPSHRVYATDSSISLDIKAKYEKQPTVLKFMFKIDSTTKSPAHYHHHYHTDLELDELDQSRLVASESFLGIVFLFDQN